MSERQLIAFHIVTGFLVADKTTLINRLLRAPELCYGVQHVFNASRTLVGWPDVDRSTRAMIIVDGVAARDVENLWAALRRAPRVDAPDLAAPVDNPLASRRGGLLTCDQAPVG